MKLLAMVVGLFIVAAGVVGIIAPGVLVTVGRDIATPTGLYVVGALRVVIGLVFVLAAPTSRMPRTLLVLGVIVVIAGVATPIFGVDRSRALIEWWASIDPLFRRLEAVFAVAFGGFITYATGSTGGRH